MSRHVDHTDLAAAGYFTEWSVPAGGTADFHLSTVDPATTVSLTRLDRRHDAAIGWPVSRTEAELGVQTLDLGASLTIEADEGLLAAEDWGLRIEFRLSAPPDDRVLLATHGLALRFDGVGRLHLDSRDNDRASAPIPLHRWLELILRCQGGRCDVAIDGDPAAGIWADVSEAAPGLVAIGASPTDAARTLNAAFSRIALLSRGREVASFRVPAVGRPARVAPQAGTGAALRVHNAPTFAVRSARWDGSEHDPRRAPSHYDAVMLHDDDLDDAGWPVTHRIAVPADAESGVYGLTVRAASQAVTWPFFVTPRRRAAELLFLVPSFTYLAYADERLPQDRFPWQCDDRGHRFAVANDLTSLYDVHNDGSGVSLASFRRPLATIRDDYLYPLCGAPHLLPVDLHLLRFLAAEGIRVDLVTDAELDRDGAACLAGYRGLVTGSHPEYWTAAMLDAVSGFQERGGHLAYLGGNGCYWVTAREGHVIEVRRGARGIRTWSSEPGETHLAMTGAPGGLWRTAGRAEHRLLGVGLAAMGFTRSRPFRRTPESHAADLAWLFDGVGETPIGADGIVLGGAAGYEIDCRSAKWGTPAGTLLLAVADGFDAAFETDPDAGVEGMPPVRSEMTLTRHRGGAMTFAAGSVAWCGALPHAQQMNPVGLITRNLLRRFTA
ncbi:MAG TPA: N,N-dimethylformamidase beta subunit family domain-containing protein [Dongiaceae bacterium]|jgi:N,N-dimethylformamidase|nr:N,N-dimethylformamidase beta subunit family domain-containing protein [Dongiaceae bacterium]